MTLDAFDFEAWRALAERDPGAYFVERERTIEAFIAANPRVAGRLRVLQADIDELRAVAGSPLRALSGIAGMMTDRLDALVGECRQLRDEFDRQRAAPDDPRDSPDPADPD